MFDHRNQQFSTILVAATIMLSALVAVLAQGVLHESSQRNSLLVIVYSVSNSLSMSFLFMCDIFCMGILWRASQFMKNRSRDHYGYLGKAIKKTKEMVRTIRGMKVDGVADNSVQDVYPDINTSDGSHQKNNDSDVTDSSHPTREDKADLERRIISHMKGDAVREEFALHETEVHRYLEERERIIDKSSYIVAGEEGKNMEIKSFEAFWQESCSFHANMAVLMFYLGSGSLIFANGTFVSSTFLFRYHSFNGGAVAFIVIFITLPLAVGVLVYMRYIEDVPMDTDEMDDGGREECFFLKKLLLHLRRGYCLSFCMSPFTLCRALYRRSFTNYTEISSVQEDVDGDYSEFITHADPCSSTDVSSMNSGSSHVSTPEADTAPFDSEELTSS